MDDLITWLRAQLDDDERVATAIFHDHTWSAYIEGGDDGWAIEGAHSGEPSCIVCDEAMAAHIARHDPARVLREVEAKRRLLDECEAAVAFSSSPDTPAGGYASALMAAARLMTEGFSDRPGYREEWRP